MAKAREIGLSMVFAPHNGDPRFKSPNHFPQGGCILKRPIQPENAMHMIRHHHKYI